MREVEAHEKRIRKELEKQDILRRKVWYSPTMSIHVLWTFCMLNILFLICQERGADKERHGEA